MVNDQIQSKEACSVPEVPQELSMQIVDFKDADSESENCGVNQIYEAENEPRQKQQCNICHRTLLKEHQMIAHMREHQGLLVYTYLNELIIN